MSLPFTIESDAADYLGRQLATIPAGQEPALITVLAQGAGGGATARWWITGEHFAVGYYDVGQRPLAQYIEVLGHRVSILPETLQRLQGRTLKLRRVVERQGWFKRVAREVLVAV